MDLLDAAVANNVQWCATVCPGSAADGVWLATGKAPPLFPDAITLRPGVPGAHLADLLSNRGSCSVKDSYADVDLAPYGFTVLFTASWIGLHGASRRTSPSSWREITERSEIERLSAVSHLSDGILRSDENHLLVKVRHGDTVALAVLTEDDDVVGISNVSGPDEVWAELTALVTDRFPGSAVVGYERDAELAAALRAGFHELRPLRVWNRDG